MCDLKELSKMGRDLNNELYEYSGISQEDQKCISVYIEKFPNGKYKITITEVVSESMLDSFEKSWKMTLKEVKKLKEEES